MSREAECMCIALLENVHTGTASQAVGRMVGLVEPVNEEKEGHAAPQETRAASLSGSAGMEYLNGCFLPSSKHGRVQRLRERFQTITAASVELPTRYMRYIHITSKRLLL